MPSGNYGPAVCGARYGVSGPMVEFMITTQDTTSANRIVTRNPNLVAGSPLSPIDTYIHTIEMSIPDIFVDGINYTTTSSPTVTNTGRFMIGCSGDPSLWELDSSAYHASKVRIYHCKIMTDGVTVFDAFPVVKDGKAGLYDRVSGKVLFNANTTGTITAGPQVPFDYEVEWVQRELRYSWLENGTAVTGGFDISEYIPSGSSPSDFPGFQAEFSVNDTTAGPAIGVYCGVNIFNAINFWKPANTNVYAFGLGTAGYTNISADIDTFHRMLWKNAGSGVREMYMDGSIIGSRTYEVTNPIAFFRLLFTNLTGDRPTVDLRWRIKSFRFSNTVDMIPVVKDDKMGFYNRVDGKVFLEKQPCLSAGPAIQ